MVICGNYMFELHDSKNAKKTMTKEEFQRTI